MIAINITRIGLTVDGHAGYAEIGNDIICAAVSALTQGLVHSLKALTNDEISYRIAGGHVDIEYKGFRLRRLLHMKSGQNMPEKYMENNGKRCIRQR